MKKTAFCAALIASGSMAPGCATVSVGAVAGEAAGQAETASATAAQQQLRASSAAFTDHAAAAGWVQPGAEGGAARQALDVLIHGFRSVDEAGVDEAPRPADVFVQSREYDVASPDAVAASLAGEIREARARVRAVNTAAADVVLGPERHSWSRREDVRAAESVVQAARRARTTFRDVSNVVENRLDESGRAVVERELAAFDVELDRLSEAADALSMAHPQVELEQVDVIRPNPGVG